MWSSGGLEWSCTTWIVLFWFYAPDSSLISLEASDRPNFFLHVERSGQLKLRKWEKSRAFWDAATFILHRDTWISGFDSLESFIWPGFFLHYMLSRLQLLKYNHSDRYRRATLFKFTSESVHEHVGIDTMYLFCTNCTRLLGLTGQDASHVASF